MRSGVLRIEKQHKAGHVSGHQEPCSVARPILINESPSWSIKFVQMFNIIVSSICLTYSRIYTWTFPDLHRSS